jgi:hypothetical protein
MGDRPLNYTTKIAARQTTGECLNLLVDAGADAVAVQYRDKQPVGLSFQLETAGGSRHFSLPVNIDAMQAVLRKADFTALHTTSARLNQLRSREHASDVAWRVVRDWLEAQLALIAAEMATIDQVMLPYLAVDEGETLYDRFISSQGLRAALEDGR